MEHRDDVGYYFRFLDISGETGVIFYDCGVIGKVCDESSINTLTIHKEVSLKGDVYAYKGNKRQWAFPVPAGVEIYALSNLIFKN